MSLIPPVIAQEKILEQIKKLAAEKTELKVQVRQAEEKLRLIEASLLENDRLQIKARELLAQSHQLFLEEWERKTEFYPDIRLQSLTKIVELVTPTKKKP